jgi:hypothetical protein
MSYLRHLCLFGSSLPPVVCRRAHVLFTLFVVVDDIHSYYYSRHTETTHLIRYTTLCDKV